MTKRHHLLKISTLVSLVSVLTMNESYGASTTANMAVNVNVVGKCSVTTNTLLFPDYDGSLPAQDSIVSSPAISVNCANNENYTI